MQNSKLFRLLQTYSDKERKKFHKWVISPFFNENEEVIALWEYLLKKQKYWSETDSKQLRKEKLASILFPEREYNAKLDAEIRVLMTYLYRLARKFLLYEQGELNRISDRIALVESLFDRKLDDLARSEIEDIEDILTQQQTQNAYFYLDVFRSKEIEAFYHSYLKSRTQNTRINYSSISDNLDLFYCLKKLYYYAASLTEKNITKNENQMFFIAELQSLIATHPTLQAHPMLQLYYHLSLLLQSDADNHIYDAFFSLLVQNNAQLSHLDSQNLHTFASNYCVKKIKAGDMEFSLKLFYLFEEQIRSGIIYDTRGFIAVPRFKNIVTLAIKLKKTDWLEQFFLPTQAQKLAPEEATLTMNYCESLVLFHKKDFAKVIRNIKQNAKIDSFFDMDGRRLVIMSYYEQNEIESSLNELYTFRKFLFDCAKQQKVADNDIQRNRDFCNFLERFIHTEPNNQTRLAKLLQEIQAALFADKEWLQNKIQHLTA